MGFEDFDSWDGRPISSTLAMRKMLEYNDLTSFGVKGQTGDCIDI